MKYIIDLNDDASMYEDGMMFYACKQVPWWCLSENVVRRLTPYTEPDRKAIEDEVWELHKDIMYHDEYAGGLEHTYQEAKSRYEAWQKQNDEIKVGDEICIVDNKKNKMIVYRTFKDRYWGIGNDEDHYGIVFCEWSATEVEKTGRHFPEVAELLEKMRGEEE